MSKERRDERMEILLTGEIEVLNKDFCQNLTEQSTVVVCGECAKEFSGKQVETFTYEMVQEEFEKLFFTYNFDWVIYVSTCMGEAVYQEIEYLDRLLSLCKRRERAKLIYILPDEVATAQYGDIHRIVGEACQELCRRHAEEGFSLLRLQVPFLIKAEKANGWMERLMRQIERNIAIESQFVKEQKLDFLGCNDLAQFLAKYMEEDENGYQNIRLYGGNVKELEEVVQLIGGLAKNVKIVYGSMDLGQDVDSFFLQHRYGWSPKEKLEVTLENWKSPIVNTHNSKTYKALRWVKRKHIAGKNAKNLQDRWIYWVEFVLLFFVCEYVNIKTRNMQLLDFADFRLFFVTIVGTMYGLRYGVIGAICSCISYMYSMGENVNWQIQFYNIINWLPFATYMLLGTMTGYTKDRYQDMIKDSHKSQEIMETKYVYLNDLYTKVLENKESYSNQIVNYKNSFGRIYAATKQLNSVRPGEIFYYAIAVLEDMMDTQQVAIYSLEGGNFARLSACSRGLMEQLTKSLRLEDIPQCHNTLDKGETWVNKERIEGQPDYAYGVYRDNVLYGMITIQQATYEQMSMEYMNRFNIVSGLISDALIRAANYQELSERRIMITGTKIMRYEPFAKEVAAQKRLQENQRANYVLLRVVTEETDYEKINAQLLSVTRKNDMLGVGGDGKVYILLSQADYSSMGIIYERMQKGGILVERVERLE